MSSYEYKHFNIRFPQEYVAHVEINRPERLNSFHRQMWLELRTIFNRLSSDPSVRLVLLSGAGPKAFSAGLDVQAASEDGPLAPSPAQDVARRATVFRRHIAEFQDCISSVEKCEKPVICILHGHSLGLAIDLCTTADIRLCAADVRFSVKEVDLGLAADVGTLSRLPKCVGSASWVKDVCLTARTFGADEAHRVGLVSGVFEDKERAVQAALELAGVMANKSPVAVQGTKEILNFSRDRSVEDGLRYTAAWNAAALQSEDVTTAMTTSHLNSKAGKQQPRRPRFAKL